MSKKNRKIQLRLYPYGSRWWALQYRIHPSECNWFQRIFNIWKYIYKFSDCGLGKWDDTSIDDCWHKYLVSGSQEVTHSWKTEFELLKDSFSDEESLDKFFDEQYKACIKAQDNPTFACKRIIY